MFYLSFAFKLDISNVESHDYMFDNCPLENKSEFQPEF